MANQLVFVCLLSYYTKKLFLEECFYERCVVWCFAWGFVCI